MAEGNLAHRPGAVGETDSAAGLDRAANVLGALSLAVADRTAAALSALLNFLDRPSVDMLGQVLGLTSSGTVRLLDRLTESGYVRREPGLDRRGTSIALTDTGRQSAVLVTRARAQVLEQALSALPPAERATFEHLAGKVLAGMIRGPGATRWIRRVCDVGVCRGADGGCPVGNAARERFSG